ncbi:MAG TPA: methyltransferase domain-containing protein, partial [Orrella sp.]
SQVRPKLVLRVNPRQASVQQVVDAFDAAGIDCTAIGGQAVSLAQSVAVQTLPGYAMGWWSVQDWSAQQAASLLELKDDQRVLDACCAPGGKTAHILELAHVDLTALDQDAERLDRVKENLNRLKLMNDRVKLKVADAIDWQSWWDGTPYDAILADVPCTASGVVRRHPDIAWLRREADLAQTVALQIQILDALWHTLTPGAILLLVTCSVFPDEGEDQAQAFLMRHADAVRLEAPGQCLPMASGEHRQIGHDGFFYAKFQRRPKHT